MTRPDICIYIYILGLYINTYIYIYNIYIYNPKEVVSSVDIKFHPVVSSRSGAMKAGNRHFIATRCFSSSSSSL